MFLIKYSILLCYTSCFHVGTVSLQSTRAEMHDHNCRLIDRGFSFVWYFNFFFFGSLFVHEAIAYRFNLIYRIVKTSTAFSSADIDPAVKTTKATTTTAIGVLVGSQHISLLGRL